MTKRFAAVFLILALTVFPCLIVRAQITPNAAKKRPTIGLVLSGGGARGFAHIGVLKVLEENHIPVDYIGGASMGALIGSLYATGRTPAEIETLVGDLNWELLLRGSPSFDNLSFRRKEDRRNIPTPITLRGRINNLNLPNALNPGNEIGLLFDRETFAYATVTNFDNLPIPFRAVGTDMVKGESVTLKSGSLARALRATMSIPGIFSPVEVDGKLLADGGLVNNIPTDVVKAMGADILIVVNIETQLADRASLDSLLGVLSQTINIASLDNSRRSLRQADFIIAPELENYTIGSFTDSKKIIDLGYQGAEQKIGLLKTLSLDDADWQAHLAARRAREIPSASLVPAFVAVEGKNARAVETIENKLEDKYTNQPLDADKQTELAKDLTDLTGTGRFSSLGYDVVERNGKKGLLIRLNKADERIQKPARLELGFDVNSFETDSVNFNIKARLTFFDIGRYGTEWRNDFSVGSNTLLATEYYRPIAQSKFFVAPRASYERRRVNLFVDNNRIADYLQETVQAGADVGYIFNPRSELRAGYTIGYQNVSRRIGNPLLPNIQGAFSTFGGRYVYDGLDRAQVPTNGVLSRNTVNYFLDSPGATGKFTQAETRNIAFHKLSDRNTLFGFGNGGTTFGGDAPFFQQFTLGGAFRLGGYGIGEFRSNNYVNGGIGVLHNPKFFPTFLGNKAYLGAWYEGGSSFEKFNIINYRQSVTGGAVVETLLGPVFIGGSVNENGRGRIYFSLGRFF